MLKLHLGCGKKKLPGYVNIDILENSVADVHADLRQLPYALSSVDMIYSCAAIEHFGRNEWIPLLTYWGGLLKSGGLLRLSTANFDACVDQYKQDKNLPQLLGLLIGGQKDDYDWHGMIFNFETLKAGLEQAGFKDVRRYDWRETDIGKAGIDDYSQAYIPHMDKANGRLMMLNVEAIKK